MNVIAPRAYAVDQSESFSIVIECAGTAYAAFGDVNGFNLPFAEGSPSADVTPALLKGPHSINHVFLHAVYQAGATEEAAYVIRVVDRDGNVRDSMGSKLDPDEELPYRDDFDLRVEVE